MNKKRYINLKLKITLIILIILLVLNVLIGLYLASNVKKKSLLVVRNYVKALPGMVDRAINNLMANGDKLAVKELIHKLSKDDNILGIHIFGPNGDISCSYSDFKTKYSTEYINSIYENFTKSEKLLLVKTEHLTFYSYYKPYKNEGGCVRCHGNKEKLIGVLNINVDVRKITNVMRDEARKVVVTLIIFSMFLTVVLTYLLNKLIIEPLKLIENGMKEVAHNNFNVRIRLRTRDEIERLARFFNFMVVSLKKANSKIDNMHRNMLHVDRLTTVGQLTASISHEIKNPLNSILINADLLQMYCEKHGTENTKRIVQSIINDAERIRKIIDQTLRFSRYSPTDDEIINLEEFLNDIQTYAKRILFDKEHIFFEVVKCEKEKNCFLKFSRIQLEQIFINIIKNAIDAVKDKEEGRITLTITCEDDKIIFIFEDNGVGIPEHLKDKIFDEFFTTKRNGTGMGLSIVKEIVDASGGEIFVESEVGKGTKFVIKLPIYEEKDEQN